MSGELKRRLLAKAKRTSRNVALSKASDNEVAARIKISGDGFIRSQEWRDLRSRVVAHYGGRCMCCGNIPGKGINVDHIKPRKTNPELALEFDNLQVLCGRCNKAKGNRHETDYRRPA